MTLDLFSIENAFSFLLIIAKIIATINRLHFPSTAINFKCTGVGFIIFSCQETLDCITSRNEILFASSGCFLHAWVHLIARLKIVFARLRKRRGLKKWKEKMFWIFAANEMNCRFHWNSCKILQHPPLKHLNRAINAHEKLVKNIWEN